MGQADCARGFDICSKMGISSLGGAEFWEFWDRNPILGLKMGILGGAIGHLVFGNRGKKTA